MTTTLAWNEVLTHFELAVPADYMNIRSYENSLYHQCAGILIRSFRPVEICKKSKFCLD